MATNHKAASVWPAKILHPKLRAAIANGAMSLQDESDLLALLVSTVGGNMGPEQGKSSDSTKLPLTNLHPVSFHGHRFCFTGTFNAGSRSWCQEQVEERGGICVSGVTKKLNYLIVGDIGNENWLHSTHGRKIEKAVEYNESGCTIAIFDEGHWFKHLGDMDVDASQPVFKLEEASPVESGSAMPCVIPVIDGDGKFAIEVAGSNQHQDEIIKAICTNGEMTSSRYVIALLRPDQNTGVSVEIFGNTIGYLSKYIAREFRAALLAGDLTEYAALECSAHIKCHEGHCRVWLDLPDDGH